jgi:hypothetical protein
MPRASCTRALMPHALLHSALMPRAPYTRASLSYALVHLIRVSELIVH